MKIEELRQRFRMPDVTFDDERGLIRVNVKTPTASGELFLHGGTLRAVATGGPDGRYCG